MAAKKVEAQKVIYQRNKADGLYYETNGKQEIIDALPEKEQKIIAEKLGDNLKLTEEGNIIYPNEQIIGSPFVVLIDWFLSQKTAVERPLDHKLFQKLVKESNINIPKKWIK
jgi:hypothetical protein